MSERETTAITDATGRILSIKGIDLVEQYRLSKAIGGAASINQVAWGMAQTAACVRSIDGVPLPYPTTESQVEFNIAKIGDAGYAAFTVWLQKQTEAMIAAAREDGAGGGPLELSGGSSSSRDSPTPSI